MEILAGIFFVYLNTENIDYFMLGGEMLDLMCKTSTYKNCNSFKNPTKHSLFSSTAVGTDQVLILLCLHSLLQKPPGWKTNYWVDWLKNWQSIRVRGSNSLCERIYWQTSLWPDPPVSLALLPSTNNNLIWKNFNNIQTALQQWVEF